MIRLLSIVLLGMFAFGQEVSIKTTPLIPATGYTKINAYVIGKDMNTRQCPADFNLYVRRDGAKPEDKNLYYVAPGAILTPQQGISFSGICIKELN